MVSEKNAQPSECYFWLYVFSVVFVLLGVVWAFGQLRYFLLFRNDDSFVEKRRPLLSATSVAIMWLAVVQRLVLYADGVFPESWLHNHVLSSGGLFAALSSCHILAGFFLLIRLWLCYFDFRRRQQMRDMEWTKQLQLKLVPWTIRYGHILGSFNVLFGVAFALYLLLVALLIAVTKVTPKGKDSSYFRLLTSLAWLLMALTAAFLYYKIHNFGDFWDVRNEIRLIAFWTLIVVVCSSLLTIPQSSRSKLYHTTVFVSYCIWAVAVTQVSVVWIIFRKEAIRKLAAQSTVTGADDTTVIRGFCGGGGVLLSCIRTMTSFHQMTRGFTVVIAPQLKTELSVNRSSPFPPCSQGLRLLDVISVKNGFKAFCYHLCNEYALESMLFIIQLLQVKETLCTKRILTKEAIGRMIDLPEYVLQIHKHKSLARVADSRWSQLLAHESSDIRLPPQRVSVTLGSRRRSAGGGRARCSSPIGGPPMRCITETPTVVDDVYTSSPTEEENALGESKTPDQEYYGSSDIGSGKMSPTVTSEVDNENEDGEEEDGDGGRVKKTGCIVRDSGTFPYRVKTDTEIVVATAGSGNMTEPRTAAVGFGDIGTSVMGHMTSDGSTLERNITNSMRLSLSPQQSIPIYRNGDSKVSDSLDAFIYLYEHYIKESSTSAVNVSYECRSSIVKVMEELFEENEHLLETDDCVDAPKTTGQKVSFIQKRLIPVFDVALVETYRLLSMDAFGRFLVTEEYQQLIRTQAFVDMLKIK